jgi:hypothetical protein
MQPLDEQGVQELFLITADDDGHSDTQIVPNR